MDLLVSWQITFSVQIEKLRYVHMEAHAYFSTLDRLKIYEG